MFLIENLINKIFLIKILINKMFLIKKLINKMLIKLNWNSPNKIQNESFNKITNFQIDCQILQKLPKKIFRDLHKEKKCYSQ